MAASAGSVQNHGAMSLSKVETVHLHFKLNVVLMMVASYRAPSMVAGSSRVRWMHRAHRLNMHVWTFCPVRVYIRGCQPCSWLL